MSSTNMTPADWQALQQAVAQGGGPYLQALAAEQNSLLNGIGGAGGSGPGNLPGTSTAGTVGADAIAAVQNQYPDLAWMLTIPDIAPLIVSAAQTQMAEPNFVAELQSTNWYKTHSLAVRNWIDEVNTDPGKALADTQAQAAAMQGTLAQMGLNPTAQQTWTLAQASLAQGWTDQQIRDSIANAITVNADGTFTFNYGGSASISGSGTGNSSAPSQFGALTQLEQSLTALSKQYLTNQNPQSIGQWVKNSLIAGQSADQAAAAYTSYLQDMAIAQFPWMQQGIQSGQTPLALVSPYSQMLSTELGINQNNIDWTKPQFSKLLSTPDPKTGTPMQNPIWKATQQVRSDPTYGWQYTPNAHSAVYSFIQGMQATMGQRSFAGVTPGNIAMPEAFQSQGG